MEVEMAKQSRSHDVRFLGPLIYANLSSHGVPRRGLGYKED
jgi:hypothetical protein